jgi:hypothetical protein
MAEEESPVTRLCEYLVNLQGFVIIRREGIKASNLVQITVDFVLSIESESAQMQFLFAIVNTINMRFKTEPVIFIAQSCNGIRCIVQCY